jgi:hypothetical protein
MEKIALDQNITWGACHFRNPRLTRDNNLRNCPPLDNRTIITKDDFWHYPLQHLPNLPYDAYYDNLADPQMNGRPKKFFAIVRNPYDRIISFYYKGSKRRPKRDKLNKMAKKILLDATTKGLRFHNSTICQYPYFYHENGTQMIDHIVHFEYLADDFNPLARKYNLNLTIPQTKVNARKTVREDVLTREDLDNETISLINTICRKDFVLGRGYEMMKPK